MQNKTAMLIRHLGRINLALAAMLLTACIAVGVYVADGGQMFSPGPLKAEPRVKVQRGGASSHGDLATNCSACHASPWSGATMADRCLDCHKNVREQIDSRGPLHGKLTGAMECRTCHTEHKGPHANLTSLTRFDHDCAAFQLDGAHRKTDCKSCHKGTGYQGVAKTCAECHQEPAFHKGQFSDACAKCHSTTTFVIAGSGQPNAKFDHDRTAFKLTGKHQAVDCKSCHKNDASTGQTTFKGTPTNCASCHSEPKVHKGRFSTNCVQCHTTNTWAGAVFDHAVFNIDHHGRGRNTCATCHDNQANFKSFTCYNCHEHTPANVKRRHNRPNLAGWENKSCADCHGRGKKRRAAVDDIRLLEDLGSRSAGFSPLVAERAEARTTAENCAALDFVSCPAGLSSNCLLGGTASRRHVSSNPLSLLNSPDQDNVIALSATQQKKGPLPTWLRSGDPARQLLRNDLLLPDFVRIINNGESKANLE